MVSVSRRTRCRQASIVETRRDDAVQERGRNFRTHNWRPPRVTAGKFPSRKECASNRDAAEERRAHAVAANHTAMSAQYWRDMPRESLIRAPALTGRGLVYKWADLGDSGFQKQDCQISRGAVRRHRGALRREYSHNYRPPRKEDSYLPPKADYRGGLA